MEDVMRMIKGLEAGSVGVLKVLRYASLSDLERQKYEFHLRWNIEIIEGLKRFL